MTSLRQCRTFTSPGQDFVNGNKMNGRIVENDKLLSRDAKLDLGNQRMLGLVEILLNYSGSFLQNCQVDKKC